MTKTSSIPLIKQHRHKVMCTNRTYMNAAYLSPTKQCKDCNWEIHDLFRGTTGKEFWGYYCSFEPRVV